MKDYDKIAKQLELREKEAAGMGKRLQTTLKHVEEKCPSYNGKARLMDRLIRLKGELNGLEANLRLERQYLGNEG